MNALIGYRIFYECSHQCFTGDDDSVLRAGLNAILVFVILVPGKFVDEVVCVGVCILSNCHISCARADDTGFACRAGGDLVFCDADFRLLQVLCSILSHHLVAGRTL